MTFFVGKKKRRATDKEPVSVWSGRLCGAKATLCLKRGNKKESHRTMKLFSRRTDNGFHNSRQVAKCPTNLVHGIAGAKPFARYDSPVSGFKSQLGYAQDLGRGPLLTGQ